MKKKEIKLVNTYVGAYEIEFHKYSNKRVTYINEKLVNAYEIEFYKCCVKRITYIKLYTLMSLIFVGTKFRGFRSWGVIREIKFPRKLVPAKISDIKVDERKLQWNPKEIKLVNAYVGAFAIEFYKRVTYIKLWMREN